MAPKFFKIIINPRDHKLRLPSEFMRRHGRNLREHVSLRAPNGSVREVQLFRSNGETWLHKGWKEFKEYYSIGFGTLLTFTYDMSSHFDVVIFDVDGLEIEYPHDTAKDAYRSSNLNIAGARVSDDSVVFLKEISTNKNKKGGRKSVKTADHYGNDDFVEILEDSSASQQRKRMRSNDSYQHNSYTTNGISDDFPAQKSFRAKPKFSSCVKESPGTKATVHNCQGEPMRASAVKLEERSDGSGNQFEMKALRGVNKETSIAYQKAKSCKFSNPFCICVMQPSYVLSNFNLNISLTFTSASLPQGQNKIKLRTMNGKTWSVKCYKGSHSSKLARGWKEFVQDNALKVGDACVFEVDKRNQLVWNVTIFRS